MAKDDPEDDDALETPLLVAPPTFYYVAIDGTDAGDSVEFGRQLELSTGWKNLLTQFLKRDATDPLRLHDPAHPYLPICMYGSVAVVCPNGRSSFGTDKFWQHYAGETPEEAPFGTKTWTDLGEPHYPTTGRATAAEKSSDFMSRFITMPVVEIVGGPGGKVARLADGVFSDDAEFYMASLLYVSSHGWLGGYMAGNTMRSFPGATPPEAVPVFEAQRPYFVVGRAVSDGLAFRGPRWIILAQCSTVNSATWAMWARLCMRGTPTVRGILAYEESAPDADAAKGITQRFFGHLRNGVPFLEAWKRANPTIKWAALVHKSAIGDTLPGWDSLPRLEGLSMDEKNPSYFGFLTANPDGEGVYEKPPPFGFKLEQNVLKKGWAEVTPDVLHYLRSRILPSSAYRLTITAPAGEIPQSGKLTMVHIRPTYSPQIDFNALFDPPHVASGQGTVSVSKTEMEWTASGGSETILLELASKSDPAAPGLESSHSYLWFRIELTTDKNSHGHDFKTQGLSYV